MTIENEIQYGICKKILILDKMERILNFFWINEMVDTL